MYERSESEYFTAKRKAARQVGIDARYHPKDLPSNAEIRDEIQILACLHEGDARWDNRKRSIIHRVDLSAQSGKVARFWNEA